MFEIIKFYYDLKMYSKQDVETFRDAGSITEEQFHEIVGADDAS